MLKFAFATLLFASAALSPATSRAEDLHYFKNYFVTGDYAVDGVGLYAKGVNGWATGTITPAEVPPGADIVAAYLYWETVETTSKPSSMNGYFDFDSNSNPNPIAGEVVGSPNTVPCWSNGGTGGPGTWLRVYRADVLRYLKVDANGNVRDVDYTHTVRLPDSGINQPGMVPHTEGASLVIVYRILDGNTPYKAVVIYDGAYTMAKGSAAFTQTLGGFYQASSSAAKMTQIVGNGQPGFAAKLTVNGNVPTGVGADPFVGAQGPRWDNLTFNITNLNPASNASSVETEVLGQSNQACLSWGAVLMSTTVVNSDSDGILDKWKTNGLHLNVGSPATSTKASVPATFGGCSDYPKDPCENLAAMGAISGPTLKPPAIHKDIFVQIDWMQGDGGHIHSPKLAALQAIAGAFQAHNINVHFDVGNRYQQFATAASKYMIVPKANAQGGHLIQESSLECPNNVIVDPRDCEYDTKDLGYSVLGWKTGIDAMEKGFTILTVAQNFAHDRKDIFHYMLVAHALAGPIDANTGLPVSPPPSVSGVGDLYGGDIMVTLGLWPNDNPTPPGSCVEDDSSGTVPDANLCTNETGTSLEQAGTMFHELGHNLGLHHAGQFDTPNCMVDYPSTMNYLYQTRGLTGPAGDVTGVANGIYHIDYSSGTLGALNETMLLGTPAIGALPYRLRYYGPATDAEKTANGNAKANCNGTFPYVGTASVRLETPAPLTGTTNIDWSNGTGMGLLSPGVYSDDIDFDGTIGDSIPGGVGFADHNDWGTLNLQQVGGRPNVSGLSVDVGPADISTNDLLGQSVLGQNVLGQNVLGQNVLGQSVLGQNVLGQSVLGQNVLGQNVLGQNVLGQNVLGQSVLGEVDYDTAVSSLDATGANNPLAGAPSASTGTAFNQVSLTWGLPNLGQIRTYTIYRTNTQALPLTVVVAGSVSGAPPTTAFTDPVTDPNASDVGANCPSTMVCYDTNYQYYIVATDINSNSSTPSNLVTVLVDHLFVTGFTGSIVYGNPLPNSMEATIIGTFPPGVSASAFTCPNPAPRNVGSYADACTGPAAVGTPATVGVTYIAGVLMITQRPLYIDAVTNTKLYDSTTAAAAAPTVEGFVMNVSGLVNGDTVTGLVEAYQSPNVLGTGGSTLVVTADTVNDGTGGGNYAVTTKNAAGTITARPLYIDATANTKLYDSTTTASAIPVVEATVPGVSGLVGSDTVTGRVELYQSPKVLGINGSTLSVSTYSVNDGNTGLNYSVTATKTASGTITARPLYIDAVTYSKVYDSTTAAGISPVVEGTVSGVSGLVGTDSVTGLSETYASANAVGTNNSTLMVVFYTVVDGNSGKDYSVKLNIATGTIIQRPLTIDAQQNTKTYDGTSSAATKPVVAATTSTTGLVGSDTVTNLAETYATPGVSWNDTLSVSPSYSVNDASGGGDYAVTLQTANGVITAAPLTAAVTGSESAAPPTFTANPLTQSSFTGFVNGEQASAVITGALSCSVVVPNGGGTAGQNPISCEGLSAANYNISYDYSALSPIVAATPAPLTVNVSGTVSIVSMTPTFTLSSFTYSGFVNGDSPSVVTGTLTCQAGAAADTAGNYPISCSGLSSPNYVITYSYSPGAGTGPAQAPLTVAVSGTVPSGMNSTAPLSNVSLTYTGFINGDTLSVVTGSLSCTVDTTMNPFVLSCSGLGAPAYYTIYYLPGTITVGQ